MEQYFESKIAAARENAIHFKCKEVVGYTNELKRQKKIKKALIVLKVWQELSLIYALKKKGNMAFLSFLESQRKRIEKRLVGIKSCVKTSGYKALKKELNYKQLKIAKNELRMCELYLANKIKFTPSV